MIEASPGTRVRFTRQFRKAMRWNGSRAHIREFGRCVGIVQGFMDYNNVPPDHPEYDRSKIGPEVDVRWQPSNLRYAYAPEALEVVPMVHWGVQSRGSLQALKTRRT